MVNTHHFLSFYVRFGCQLKDIQNTPDLPLKYSCISQVVPSVQIDILRENNNIYHSARYNSLKIPRRGPHG